MEIRTSEEARTNIVNFTKRFLNLQQQKKVIDQDISALKDEFKEEGVPVSIVQAVINKIKRDKKKTDSERFEEDTIQEWLVSDADVDNSIGELMAK